MNDTTPIQDTRVTRRYFAKFERITQHIGPVAGVMKAEGSLVFGSLGGRHGPGAGVDLVVGTLAAGLGLIGGVDGGN